MQHKRVHRINSLLKEVLSEVIMKEVKDPRMAQFVTITSVDTTADLHHAKVYVSILGTDIEKRDTLEALESAAGFIGVNASKKVTMRFFPTLTFKLDTSVDKHMKIDELLEKIHKDDESR